MGKFKLSFLGALGFFIPTLVLLTVLNLSNLPHIGSIADGLLFSLYFSAIYFGGMYGGSWALQIKQPHNSKSVISIILGALMGDIAWAFISILWILPVMRDTYVMVLNAIFINSLLIFFAGLATNLINVGRVYTPATK